MNSEWERLTEGKPDHKCGHEKKLKGGKYNMPLMQYYCHSCKASFCGDCAFDYRVPASKTQ